jgi:hypothetical protein
VTIKLIPCNHKKRHFVTSFIIAALFGSVVTLFFWLIIFQYISAPSFLTYTNLVDSYILSNPKAAADPLISNKIGELVRNGTIMSIKDLWSFESSFYQTIITVLIFINALLGSVAFFVIRSSSIEQARVESRKAAADEVNIHIKSQTFSTKVVRLIKLKVEAIKNDVDYDSNTINLSADRIEILEESNKKLNDLIKGLVESNHSLKSQIGIISEHISKQDMDDNEGLTLKLSPDGDN